MDLTVLNLAVPSLSADLRPSSTQLLWIVDIYGFVLAGSLITMGTLGDRFGRRRLLLIGAVVFGLTSVLAAFSTGPEMPIAARALQAPAFTASLVTYALGTFVGFGLFVFIAQYLQLVLGLSTWRAGLWTAPYQQTWPRRVSRPENANGAIRIAPFFSDPTGNRTRD